MKHCCDIMRTAIQSKTIPVSYYPKFREYGIAIQDGGSSYLQLLVCPWCGERQPDSLREDWAALLAQLGYSGPKDPRLPARLRTSAWWRWTMQHKRRHFRMSAKESKS